ncbi:hypothetical protein [Paraburkholderia sp. ZP32-5]|uniref:hypothetical protein n=1 Tax=Paraburkholderia sp. ZP32-5 TaxID=2883245 RepID=UPI001F1F21FD|nr:hypothetical protein [Paraburkholderia sp. ZP32-5]
MFSAIGSDAAVALFAALLAASVVALFALLIVLFVEPLTAGAGAPGIAVVAIEGTSAGEVDVAAGCALSLAAASVAGFVVAAVFAEDPSSAPQPFNANVATASSAALAMSLVFLMSASGSVKADAVSNSFKKFM